MSCIQTQSPPATGKRDEPLSATAGAYSVGHNTVDRDTRDRRLPCRPRRRERVHRRIVAGNRVLRAAPQTPGTVSDQALRRVESDVQRTSCASTMSCHRPSHRTIGITHSRGVLGVTVCRGCSGLAVTVGNGPARRRDGMLCALLAMPPLGTLRGHVRMAGRIWPADAAALLRSGGVYR